VTHVHAQGHLRLLAIAAERSLAHEQADKQTPVEVRERANGVFGARHAAAPAVRERKEAL
jgi:hypothetical protein